MQDTGARCTPGDGGGGDCVTPRQGELQSCGRDNWRQNEVARNNAPRALHTNAKSPAPLYNPVTHKGQKVKLSHTYNN